MLFDVTIKFPGTDWAEIHDTVEFHDRAKVLRGETERTALTQIESFVRSQKHRYAKYGADVTWKTAPRRSR